MKNKTSPKIFIFYLYKELKIYFSVLILCKILKLFFAYIPWDKYVIFIILLSFLLDSLKVIQKYFYLSWNFNNDTLNITKGIFFKKSITVKSSQIRGIHVTSPWFFRIINSHQLTVFLPSTGDNNKITFDILTPKQVESFNIWQESNQIKQESSPQNTLFNIKLRQLLLSSIFSLNYLFIFSLITFIDNYTSRFNINISSMILNNYQNPLVIALLIIGSILSSFIKQIFNYYFLKVRIINGTLKINNGILSNETVTVHQSDIIGFIYSQNLGQKIFNLWTVKAIIKNYGIKNNQTKISAILPFATLKDINDFEKQLYGNITFSNTSLLKKSSSLIIYFLTTIGALLIAIINFLLAIPFIVLLIILYLKNIHIKKTTTTLYINKTSLHQKTIVLRPFNIEWEEQFIITPNISYNKLAYSHNPVSVIRYLNIS